MSSYADEGTIAHALAERCLTTGQPAIDFLGEVFTGEDRPHSAWSPSGAPRYMRCVGSIALAGPADFAPRKFEHVIDREMCEFVQIYVDNIYEYCGDDGQLFVEQYGEIEELGVEEGGTGDAIILKSLEVSLVPEGGLELQVHDLKYGRGVEVDVSYIDDAGIEQGNEQLMLYALAQLRQVALISDKPVASILIVIHQPRINALPLEHRVTVGELLNFALKVAAIRDIGRQAEKDLASDMTMDDWAAEYLIPGDKQCRFCRALHRCPAVIDMVQETVFGPAGADAFENLDAPADPAPIPQMLGLLEIYMERTDLIEHWIGAVRAEVEKQLLAGAVSERFKLVRGKKGNRAWSDESKVEKMLKAARYKKDQMYSMKLITPTAAQKLIAKDAPKRWALFEKEITQSDGALSVAPMSDKREAVKPAAVASDFEDVSDDGASLIS